MKNGKSPLKTGIPTVCPCCGSTYMTAAELSLVIALYSATGPKTALEIASLTGGNERTVRRTIMSRRNWLERTESLEEKAGCPQRYLVARYTLSSDGHRVAERVTGVGGRAKS